MKAAQYSKHGAPDEVIEVVDIEPPALAAGEARCEVLAAPINPSDELTLRGSYAILPPLPAIGGNEGVGRVVELGDGVNDCKVGQTVLLPVGCGTWQQQVVAKAAELTPFPDGIDPVQLSMLAINPPTAMLMLDNYTKLSEGDWVVQNAANSAVGRYVIQLAKRRGLRTCNVVRRDGLEESLKSDGADVVLVDGPDLGDRVKEATGGGARLGIDAVAGAATARLAAGVANGCSVVNYGVLSGDPCEVSPMDLIFRGVQVHGFWLATWFQKAEPAARMSVYGELTKLIAEGALHADVEKTYSVEQAREALAHAMKGGRSGKIVFTPSS